MLDVEFLQLFEKGSNKSAFEIPAFCSKDLFGENGKNLQRLQKQYNVSINVKNYRNDNRRSLRVGDEEQKIQRTMKVILIGEPYDQQACRKGIDRLIGIFRQCYECKFLTKEEDGYPDIQSGTWFCQRCWDEFNGVSNDKDDAKGVTKRMDNVHFDNYDNQQQGQYQQQSYNNSHGQQRRVGTYNDYHHAEQGFQGGQKYQKNKW